MSIIFRATKNEDGNVKQLGFYGTADEAMQVCHNEAKQELFWQGGGERYTGCGAQNAYFVTMESQK